jgi:hypothetical protein
MSSSPKSKSESASSLETGDAAPDTGETSEVSRKTTVGWSAFGILFGTLLILKLGTVGVWIGIGLVIFGVYRAWKVVETYLNPPGTIKITDSEVVLPRGLSTSRPHTVKPSEVTAVYFLRRSVPWNNSSPVLVVELGDRAIAYPRDWFASEADQRHIVHALVAVGFGAQTAPKREPNARDLPRL